MGHGHKIEIVQEQYTPSVKAKRITLGIAIIGLILSGIGFAMLDRSSSGHDDHGSHHSQTEASHAEKSHESAHADDHKAMASSSQSSVNPDFPNRAVYEKQHKSWSTRIYSSVLISGYYILMIALAAMFFMAVQYIANAGWSAAIKRIPEAMFTFTPVAFIIVFGVLLLAKNELYHWAHYEHLHLAKDAPGYDPILAGKSGFLNTPMLLIFPTVLVLLWLLIGRKLRKLSVMEDAADKGETKFFKKSIVWSAVFSLLYGFTLSVVAWLYIMSIDAHWFSTIFGVYNFATSWVTAITIICLFVIYLKSQGYLKIVTDEHVHDLGKFMFAFSIFWAYIWISQYLLIWYAHIPEEMAYYQIRYNEYKPYFLANITLNFFTPFLVLMMRNAKRNNWVLAIAGLLMIFGHYNDVWLMVMPGVYGPGMNISILDIGIFMLLAGVFAYWTLIALSKRGLIAVNHPYIEESAHHDVGV